MSKKARVAWLKAPEKQDYLAALSYLSLIYETSVAEKLVAKLKRAPITDFKAKDIFRASGLRLLGVSNFHVDKDCRKIIAGHSLSPLLLVRDQNHGRVVIADGYHRMCSVYAFNEDAVIPCRIV